MPYHATLVSHTHWDRAWYCTFQEYRIRLVRLVDRLLDILNKDPEYRAFMLDGQMSVLEDYLEVRPGKAAELQALCRSGRLQVGPWFVLADEFLVSPEALIRNLRLGHEMGQAYGGVAKIGYVPDGFGHMAQLPQILRGFGIDNAFYWRGMGSEGDKLGTEFTWRAPDGSAVTTMLMPWGYHNVTNLGYGIHWGDTSEMVFNMDLAQEKIERALQKLMPMTNTRVLLLMNGIDHAEAEPRIPQIIQLANERLGDVQITQGTLAQHLAQVRAVIEATGKTLPEFCGEFRWGRYSEILQGVYSTRIHLKQNNHRGEVLLERYAEPLTALAWASGAETPEGVPDLLKVAWHWLLLNHPHDDIYGSGIDEVHHEMAHRFGQSRQIADVLVRDSLRALGRQADCSGQAGMPLIAFNPLGWERREIAEAVVDFEYDDPLADDFQVVDAEGRLLAHQVVEDRQEFWMEVLKPNRKHRVKMLVPTATPGCGYTTLYVQPRSAAQKAPALSITEHGAENSFHRLTIEADGGLIVTDKASGRTYVGLNHFYDVEDAGDEYTSCPFEKDSQTISTVGCKATVTPLEAGPLRATFRVEHMLNLPAGLTEDRKHRSGQTISHNLVSDVSLYAGQPGIFITTRVNNQAHDHKLSVHFPTGVRAAVAHVDESFMVATRELALPDSTGWVEDPTPLMHQRAFTDLSDKQGGVAVLNRGLPSVEVHPDGTIALTLLRCVGWLSRDDLWVRRVAGGPLVPTPGAQCPGEYTFEYAILPHARDWQAGEVYRHAYNFNVPPIIRRADTHAGLELHEMNITRDDPAKVTKAEWPRGGPLPHTLGVVSLEPPELVLSAVYRSGEHIIVRCYNVTATPVRGSVRFGLPVRAVERVNLNEETQEVMRVSEENGVPLQAGGGEVITLKVTWERTAQR